jgi:N-acyl-D-aspartate/D-glutamate deacylase
MTTPVAIGVLAPLLAVALIGAKPSAQTRPSATYDILLRHGTVIDGTGTPRRTADIAIDGDRIVRIGNLGRARARTEIDITGLMVAPGFINLHSHATPVGLTSAANMLTQGVTTELLNADGSGPLDLKSQRTALRDAGLAVNIGTYIGFNSVWASVVGPTDRRPTPAETDSMRGLVRRGLEAGAFGVSSGLDYKPGYFATADEVIAVVEPARPWRTNFTNHDRLSPEHGYSSRAGMEETMQIGLRAGLLPIFTHMKVQGHEQGTSDKVVAWMTKSTKDGHYVASDIYPYVAGQTSLTGLLIPGWAQDGGRARMIERFRDPVLRARIIKETDDAMQARLGGASSVFLIESQRELVDVQRELGAATGGEAIVRILETGDPGMIARFGAESDLSTLLQYPSASIACDCGAAPPDERRVHPRWYGTYPRVLGRYVRELHTLTWEAAIRKMTGLPASTIGLVDRGFLAPGMYADIVVFDSATVIDHATYAKPTEVSDGIRYVLVNGTFALTSGAPTGQRAGRALERTAHMPSRPLLDDVSRTVSAKGRIASASSVMRVALTVTQLARSPIMGQLRVSDAHGKAIVTGADFGLVQTSDRWGSVTGRVRVAADDSERAFTVIVEEADPMAAGSATVTLHVDGMPEVTGTLTGGSVTARARSSLQVDR